LLLAAPQGVQGRVVILGVIYDHHHTSSRPAAGLTRLLQERPSRLPIERVGLAREHELPIAEPHGAKIPHALAGGMMEQHWVFDLRRDPHSAARAVLLEMHFVHGPQINGLVVCQLVEFFYRRPVPRDRLTPRPGAAFAAGNLTAGKDAGTASRPRLRPTAGAQRRLASCHPTGWHRPSQLRSGCASRRLRSSPHARHSSAQVAPIWAARSNRRTRSFRIGSPSTPPSAGRLPEVPPLLDRLARVRRGGRHANGDRSMIRRSDGFHLGGPKSLFGRRQWSKVSYPVTIV